MKYLILGFVLCTVFNCFSQIENIPDAFGTPMRSKSGEQIEGSVYSNLEWNKGTIFWSNGSITHDVYLKYNVLSGNIEVQKSSETWVYTTNHIQRVEYSFSLYPNVVTVNYVPASNFFSKKKGFARVIYLNKLAVFEFEEAELVTSAPSYGSSQSVTKVVKKSKTYIKFPGKEPVTVRLTAAGVSKITPDANVKKFIKENSLDVSSENDLKRVLVFIESTLDSL